MHHCITRRLSFSVGMRTSCITCILGKGYTSWIIVKFKSLCKQNASRQKRVNVIDEFIQQAFTAHLMTAICDQLHLESPHDNIPHEESCEWLHSTVESVVKRITPFESSDPINALHRCFLYAGFSYVDLQNAVRDGEGKQIIRQWRHWLILFLGTNRKNYANEPITHLSNITAIYPRHIAIHNGSVNTTGRHHHYKPLDQMLEHYNL